MVDKRVAGAENAKGLLLEIGDEVLPLKQLKTKNGKMEKWKNSFLFSAETSLKMAEPVPKTMFQTSTLMPKYQYIDKFITKHKHTHRCTCYTPSTTT